MALLDFILNLAGLLLWLNWRFLRVSARAAGSGGISLAGTLKNTQSSRTPAWPYLAYLVGLLLLRAVAYCTIGSNLRATLVLDLGLLPISFNPRWIMWMLLFSGLSFISFSAVFYSWLLLFSLLNRGATDPDACVRWIRVHLGWFERLAPAVKLLLPFLAGFVFWLLGSLLFERLGVHPAHSSTLTWLLRALLFGASTYLSWMPVLLGLMVFHLIATYIYLGESVWVGFLTRSARSFLNATPALRVHALRMDLGPLIWIGALSWLIWTGTYGRVQGGTHLLVQLWNSLV